MVFFDGVHQTPGGSVTLSVTLTGEGVMLMVSVVVGRGGRLGLEHKIEALSRQSHVEK